MDSLFNFLWGDDSLTPALKRDDLLTQCIGLWSSLLGAPSRGSIDARGSMAGFRSQLGTFPSIPIKTSIIQENPALSA